MKYTSLVKCTSRELLKEAATFTAMAARANTFEARQALESLAARYRELAARRAVLACLAPDDPATPVIAQSIERLIRDLSGGNPPPIRR